KMLKVRPVGSTHYPWKIYDVWGFFSATGSFAKTLDKWGISHDPIIEEGKDLREDFPPGFDVERYNLSECLTLRILMEKFYSSLKILDDVPGVPRLSRIRSWHGAGALADKMLAEMDAENLRKGDFSWDRLELEEGDLMDAFPLDVWKAIWAGRDTDVVVGRGSLKKLLEKAGHVLDYKRKMAYFGGRIELLQRGEFDRVYNYDINSCYPRAIIDLPDLSASKVRVWDRFKEEDLMNSEFGLC